MRRILISLLLASVASPVLAAGPGRDGPRERPDRSEAKSERKAERQADRPQRSAEPRNVESATPQRSVEPRNVERAAPGPRSEPRNIESGMRERSVGARGGDDGPVRSRGGAVRQMRGGSDAVVGSRPQVTPAETVERRSAGDGVRERRMRERTNVDGPVTIEQRNVRRAPTIRESGELVQQKRPVPRVFERAERRVSRTPILGTEPPPPRTATAVAARPARSWSHHWRNDRRYDWRDWRKRHRSRFFFGFYNDPFGWDYFRYGVGWRLWPSYYGRSFWLNDPWHYRLPPAYGPYRWIRYYDDALLVNIYTGHVVDVVHNFFW